MTLSRIWFVGGAGVVVGVALTVGAVVIIGGRGESDATSAVSKCALTAGKLPSEKGSSIQVLSSPMASGGNGDTTVYATVEDGSSMNAFDLTGKFDASVLAVKSVCVGDAWGQSLTGVWDNSRGTFHVAAFQLGSGCAETSGCPLIKITWQARRQGSTQVTFDGSKLAGSHGDVVGDLPGIVLSAGLISVQ